MTQTVMARERSDEAIQTRGYRSRFVWIASSLRSLAMTARALGEGSDAIAVLAVKATAALSASRDLTAPRGDGCWRPCLFAERCGRRPLSLSKRIRDAKRHAAE